jgi:hypothetical protein
MPAELSGFTVTSAKPSSEVTGPACSAAPPSDETTLPAMWLIEAGASSFAKRQRSRNWPSPTISFGEPLVHMTAYP